MTQPKMFGEMDLRKALTDAGSKLARRIPAYLIGGCAMTFMGRKVATKDIDVVFASTADAEDFAKAMEAVGFAYVHKPSSEYGGLGTFAIMENSRGMRFDIYDRVVCHALQLSTGMRSRAQLYQNLGNLDVYLVAPDDIFLFKGITEREADLDDMRILAEVGLDWPGIEKECIGQKSRGRWADMLGTKLMELRTKFGIESPIIRTLIDHADMELLTHVFGEIIGQNERTFKEIASAIEIKYRYSASWTRKQLRILAQKRAIGIRKKVPRGYIYFMEKRVQRGA